VIREPATATVSFEVSDRNTKEILEGLHDAIATNVHVEHDSDGSVSTDIELVARGLTMTPSKPETDSDTEPAVYSSEADWDTGRVDPSEWGIEVETAKRVYDRLLTEVTKGVKHGDPEVVIVGEPQYRALWVYVDEVHTRADNPEQLVPLRMVVVPGPQLHVETRNLDVLFGL